MSYPKFSIVGAGAGFRVRHNARSGATFWPGTYPTRAAAKAALQEYDRMRWKDPGTGEMFEGEEPARTRDRAVVCGVTVRRIDGVWVSPYGITSTLQAHTARIEAARDDDGRLKPPPVADDITF